MTIDTSMSPMSFGHHPIFDRDAEREVIGTAFISSKATERLTVEEGLRAHHFYSAMHSAIWTAMLAAVADGEEPVPRLVAERLDRTGQHAPGDGWIGTLEECVACAASPGNVRVYARRIIDAWRRETRRRALIDGLLAVDSNDDGAFAKALGDAANTAARASGPNLTDPAILADHFGAWLLEPKTPGLPTPWPRLGRLLKLRPGQTTVLGGWTSIGKSMVSLHLAAHVGQHGLRSVVWSNEMSEHEIVARHVTRQTRVSYEHIMDGDVQPRDADKVLEAVRTVPFGVQPCHGWPAAEIAAHIRAVKPDLAVVDHFHALPAVGRTDQADEAISALIASAAQCGTHLVVVAQLNQARNQSVIRQAPVLRDLRGTGNLFNLPNNVLFVHRREIALEGEDGVELGQATTTEEGHFDVAKQRGGPSNQTVEVRFDPFRMRFLETA